MRPIFEGFEFHAAAGVCPPVSKWVNWTKGTKVGEWSRLDFSSREEAVTWARAQGVEATVSEVPVHSSMPYERVTVHADGREQSSRQTTIG